MSKPIQGTHRYLIILLVLCAATTVIATVFFAKIVRRDGVDIFYIAMLAIFIPLYFWIAIGFWTATFGFVRGIFYGSQTSNRTWPSDTKFPPTSIIMPICNENVGGVFSRVQAMYEEIARTGKDASFDFFILSDTSNPDIWLEEEQAWGGVKALMRGRSGLYYRHRYDNRGRKSGNIQEFCENWGSDYKYMVVLDADSLMTAETILEMVWSMEQDTKIGILQSAPLPVGRSSFFGRLQQFAAHMYGPIFTSGYALWSQVAGTYWGHNAIIRVRAFMDCCGLPELPGSAPLGGEILSHDFVEAAFMLRKGWKVIIDHNLPGSYEECPTNLINFANRDQRWCQGNMQHFQLIFQHGLRVLSRAQLGMGAMSYLSSPMWAAFLVLSVLMGFGIRGSDTADRPASALVLFIATMLLLMLPKVWALLLALFHPSKIEGFAGPWKAVTGVILEITASVLMAPLLMVFHTTFIITALLGHSVQWLCPKRTDDQVSMADAFRVHAMHTIVGISGALLVTWHSPQMLPWLMLVLLPLAFSVPISMILGSQHIGEWLRKNNILIIPQEIKAPVIVQHQQSLLGDYTASMRDAPHPFTRVVAIPELNALHIAMLPEKAEEVESQRIDRLKRVALTGGAAHLTNNERKEIISDAAAMEWLHKEAWQDWPVELLERCKLAH